MCIEEKGSLGEECEIYVSLPQANNDTVHILDSETVIVSKIKGIK